MISEKCCILEKSRKNLVKFGENSAKFWQVLRIFGKKQQKFQQFLTKILRLESVLFAAPFHRSSKWLAARCLLASRFLVFFLFGVVLARPFFPQFSSVDSKNGAKECIVQISARAFQRVLTCKIWLRYSRERALKSSGNWEIGTSKFPLANCLFPGPGI